MQKLRRYHKHRRNKEIIKKYEVFRISDSTDFILYGSAL